MAFDCCERRRTKKVLLFRLKVIIVVDVIIIFGVPFPRDNSLTVADTQYSVLLRRDGDRQEWVFGALGLVVEDDALCASTGRFIEGLDVEEADDEIRHVLLIRIFFEARNSDAVFAKETNTACDFCRARVLRKEVACDRARGEELGVEADSVGVVIVRVCREKKERRSLMISREVELLLLLLLFWSLVVFIIIFGVNIFLIIFTKFRT